MLQAEFDRFADQYHADHAENIRVSGEDPEFFAEYKIADVHRVVGDKPMRILDFGAGIGNSVSPFRKYYPDAELICLDVSEQSLDLARGRFPGMATYRSFDGVRIPLEDEEVDLAFTSCVFHHIPKALQPGLLREIHRVLRRDGDFFLFEHNPLNPLTLHAVNTCPFDENAVLIRAGAMRQRMAEAGFAKTDLAYRIFFPGIVSALRPLERCLTWLPLGAQYYVHGRKTVA